MTYSSYYSLATIKFGNQNLNTTQSLDVDQQFTVKIKTKTVNKSTIQKQSDDGQIFLDNNNNQFVNSTSTATEEDYSQFFCSLTLSFLESPFSKAELVEAIK